MSASTDRKKLGHAPLTLALCQIRFSTMRNMGSYVPQIQETLRRDGYRLDMSSKVQEFNLGPQGAQPQSFDRWEFLNVAKTRGVIITEQFAAYQTTAYTTFEDFIAEVIRLMDALVGSGADVLITRFGLRYVNAIVPTADKIWRGYVNEGLHGVQSSVLTKMLSAHHVFGETAHGRMLARVTQNTEGLLVPIELAHLNLSLLREPPTGGSIITLIDIDHFKEWTMDFSGYQPEPLQKLAWDLKNDIYAVFHSFVTPAAMKEWA